jgi:endonuclease YncB( thermonuclease family)
MKKIKLSCVTGGFKYGDIVAVGKDGIEVDVAKSLVAEGLATVAEEETVKTKKDTKKDK